MRLSLLLAMFLVLCFGCVTAENIPERSTKEICQLAHLPHLGSHHQELLAAELDRRGIFADQSNTKHKPAVEIIRKGYIWRGMTEKQLRCARGTPLSVNHTVGAWGIHKQWVYGDTRRSFYRSFVYTKNGVVTSWQY